MAVIGRAANRHWEEEMLGEYLAAHHQGKRVFTRLRLGPHGASYPDPTLTDAEKRALGAAFRRWADAAVVDQGRLYLIETALIPDPRDISLLVTYLMLVDHTPELEDLRELPRVGRLVWAVDDPFSRQVAVQAGLEVAIFKPSHWSEWIRTVRARESRPARTLLGGPAIP